MNYISTFVCKSSSSCLKAVELARDTFYILWSFLLVWCTACYQGAKTKVPFFYDVALNLPYILSRTPEEHALEAYLVSEHWNTVMQPIRTDSGTIYEPYLDMPPVPIG